MPNENENCFPGQWFTDQESNEKLLFILKKQQWKSSKKKTLS